MEKFSLIKYFKKYAVFYVISVLAVCISIVLDMYSPQITRQIVDDVICAGHMEKLRGLLIFILCIGGCRCIFQYTKEFLCDIAGSKIGSEVRLDLFKKIQSLSANFFDGINSGELMSRVRDDVDRIWELGAYVGILMAEVLVRTVTALYFMFRLNWLLAIIPSLGMLFAAFIAIKMENKLDDVYGEIEEENSKLNNTAQENLAGVRTVKAFSREPFEILKFKKHNERYYQLNIEQSKVFVKYHPFIQAVSVLLPCFVLLAGGMLVIKGNFSIGQLSAFIQYSMNIVWPMEMLGWLTNGISSARASVKRINKIYEETPDITEKEAAVQLKKIDGSVEFENVSYVTNTGRYILKNVSFNIKAGETLGIMGATGSGKTTVINLLKRMYDVSEGAIKLDGVDIRDLPLGVLRKAVACVMQDVFLFSDTIDGNIRLGEKKNLTEEEVDEALKNSCSSEFVDQMKEKAETVVGERGIGLSGGQKQRLTIARAISRNAPVLVLDDSTSALDTETEQHIQGILRKMSGMTKIIIAHRISAVRNADKIIVLENGAIAECGTHAELLEKKGLYWETYQSQH